MTHEPAGLKGPSVSVRSTACPMKRGYRPLKAFKGMNWARLIQKIYEVDPLTCRKCSGKMKLISVIEDEEVIKKILKHLGLRQFEPRPPPKVTEPTKIVEHSIDYSTSQLPASDNWLYLDPVYPEASAS
ncbi:MAG: hypothetical protein JRJ85_02270 [Deltaproteobacteria bacterium]|nr:hypothetical protein [Deltaproteobacteria bacterium]